MAVLSIIFSLNGGKQWALRGRNLTVIQVERYIEMELVGGLMEKKKAISNKPSVPLFPTKENLSRYAAVCPGHSINRKHMSDKLFSADYPQ